MWLVCSASPGPSREAVRRLEGHRGGVPSNASLVPAPGERGIPLPSPGRGAAGGATARALWQPAAWEGRRLWLQVQKLSRGWQNVCPVFLGTCANLWGRGKWDTAVSERWSGWEQKVFPCWIFWIMCVLFGEREFRTFSAGYRMRYPLIRNQS